MMTPLEIFVHGVFAFVGAEVLAGLMVSTLLVGVVCYRQVRG